MKATVLKNKPHQFDDVVEHRSLPKSDDTPVDPATNRRIARDLRFRHFVAHQREFYFLNQSNHW